MQGGKQAGGYSHSQWWTSPIFTLVQTSTFFVHPSLHITSVKMTQLILKRHRSLYNYVLYKQCLNSAS